MVFGPQRGSALTIFDKFASTFGMPIVVVLLALVSRNMEALLENGIILAILLASPVLRLVSYISTYYYIDEEKFHVKSGIFNKKNLEIPLDGITTVDFTQNLIFQWAGIYSIKVDNASNYGGNGNGKIELALKKSDAVRFKELLLSKKKKNDEEDIASYRLGNEKIEIRGIADINSGVEKSKTIPVKNILIMGALQSKGTALAEAISIFAALVAMLNIVMGKTLNWEGELAKMILSISGLSIALILVLGFFILSTVLGALFALIKYYGFKITDSGKSIHLEYGLLTKKNHSLLKEKISGVEFVQSLPMRMIGAGYLNVLAVGYGDIESGGEKAMMYPMLKHSQLYELISEYIPGMEAPETSYEKPLKSSLKYFFICPRMIFSLVLALVAVAGQAVFNLTEISPVNIDWIWWLIGIFVLACIVSVVVEYRNTGICAEEDNINFVNGGFLRVITVLKTPMIESVSDSGSRLKRRKGVVTVRMGVLAPLLDSTKIVRNMHTGAVDSIKKMIRY